MLGFEKIFHQPFEASADAGRIDVMKSPKVGTSQSSAEHREDEVDRRLRDEAQDPSRRRSSRGAGSSTRALRRPLRPPS